MLCVTNCEPRSAEWRPRGRGGKVPCSGECRGRCRSHLLSRGRSGERPRELVIDLGGSWDFPWASAEKQPAHRKERKLGYDCTVGVKRINSKFCLPRPQTLWITIIYKYDNYIRGGSLVISSSSGVRLCCTVLLSIVNNISQCLTVHILQVLITWVTLK